MARSLTVRTELLFSSRLGRPPEGVTTGCGRVVLLGEHLDHQGGAVLAVPLREGVAVAYAVRPDSRVAVWAINAKAKDHFTQGQAVKVGRRWSDLARGATVRVGEELKRRLPGLDLLVLGDLVTQQGLGSSAAYVTALLRALYAVAAVERSPAGLAVDAAWVERHWGGVACGPMDPYVAAVGREHEVLLVDCAALTHRGLSLPPDGAQVDTVDSGVRRALAQTPYDARRQELLVALKEIHTLDPQVRRLTQLSPERFRALADQITAPPRLRARHVVEEGARVTACVAALEAGDAAAVGHLMNAGHESLATLYGSTTPEIDARVHALQAEPGVLGARLQGGGWGGRIAVLRDAGDTA